MRYVASVAALLGLAACGGGGGSLGGGGFATVATEYNTLFPGGVIITSAPDNTGNPTYEGVMLVASDLDPADGTSASGYLGTVEITMNFATDEFSGTGSSFYDTDLDTTTGAPIGVNTGPNPDGTIVSSGVTFVDNSATAARFYPTFDGIIDGKPLGGTGVGLFRGPSGQQITIFEEDPDCDVICDFTFDGLPADVVIIAD
ncbi:MAG: hypothetical protein HKP37_09140 [Boseongicola sp.]|nr:hypothetical protein [Boseongicola sp.]